jgi:hypothetical protein
MRASCHFHAGADHRIKNQLNPAWTEQSILSPTLAASYTTIGFPFQLFAAVDDRS